MYFDTNESKIHLEAKEKLFDLILSKRIKIIDQNDNEFKVFTGEYEDEFLHIESFVMDYNSDVIFSNVESPCKKYMDNKTPKCNMKGYFGAFKELPCERCISNNFKKETIGSSKFASYRPDVSFGYGGKHKVWFEIKNTSPCSENKINFCKENGIVLLEIDANDILRFKAFNGVLKFDKIEEYAYAPNIYKDVDEIIEYIGEELKVSNFIYFKDVLKKLMDSPSNELFFQTRIIQLLIHRIRDCFKKIDTNTNQLRVHYDIDRDTEIIISKSEYENLNKMKIINNGEFPDGISIVEPTDSLRKVFCFKCKEKDQAKNLIRTEDTRKSKVVTRYFHEGCLNEYLGK